MSFVSDSKRSSRSQVSRTTIGECPLCGSAGAASKEDVLPRWLLAMYEGTDRDDHGQSVEGPWTFDYGGTRMASLNQMERVHLMVCEGCNRWLKRIFEVPARPALHKLLAGGALIDTEVDAMARWAVKTQLLHGHPATRFTATAHLERDGVIDRGRLTDIEPVVRRLRSGRGEPPPDVSLWSWLRDDKVQAEQLTQHDRLHLPRTTGASGSGRGGGHVLGFGFSDDSGRRLQFGLLWHPLMNIAHPYHAWESFGCGQTLRALSTPIRCRCSEGRTRRALAIGTCQRLMSWFCARRLAGRPSPPCLA